MPGRRYQRSNTKRSAVHRTLSISALLLLGLGIAAIPSAASAAAPAGQLGDYPISHPDFDPDALHLSTITDTLPGDAATHFQALAGNTVRRVYILRNNGLLPLENVTVSDPDADGAIACGPDGTPTIATLLPLTWGVCSATFTAVPGEHYTTVTASGTVFLLGFALSDEADAGYTAVSPALSASLTLNGGKSTANLPTNHPVSAVLTVLNSGSAPLTDLAPLAPQPPLSILGCGNGPMIASLAPGQSASCTGALTPAAGRHVSSVTITGDWQWTKPITAQGPQAPQVIQVQTVADAPYTGIPVTTPTPAPPPPPPSPAASVPAPPPTPAAVFPPQSPSPTPSRTPPPHRPTPTPAPVAAQLQAAVSQFRASRGLSLPLKVLVIIIIPAVAGAVGARRVASDR